MEFPAVLGVFLNESLLCSDLGEGELNIPGGLFKWLQDWPPESPFLGPKNGTSQISHFGAL